MLTRSRNTLWPNILLRVNHNWRESHSSLSNREYEVELPVFCFLIYKFVFIFLPRAPIFCLSFLGSSAHMVTKFFNFFPMNGNVLRLNISRVSNVESNHRWNDTGGMLTRKEFGFQTNKREIVRPYGQSCSFQPRSVVGTSARALLALYISTHI